MRIEQTRRLHAAGILPSPTPCDDVDGLGERLSALRLGFAAEAISELLSTAVKQQQSFAAFLDSLLRLELERQDERRVIQAIRISHLPTGPTIANFDFPFQPTVSRSQIETLGTGQWIRDGQTLLLQGPPGVGKEQIREFLSTTLKLTLSDSKTLITHASQGKARFLGYEVQVMSSNTKVSPGKGGGLRRCVNGLVGLYVPRDVIEAKVREYSTGGKPYHKNALLYQSDFHIVSHYQAVYRGLVNYYRMAHNLASRFGKLRWVLETSMVSMANLKCFVTQW